MATRRDFICWGVFWFLFCVYSVRCEENSSLGKDAVQSTDHGRNWTAEKAVDGCLNQVMAADCCTHTDLGQKNAWWQVDLGRPSTISYITIYNRDEENTGSVFHSRFGGYQIYLSNISDWSQGALCYEDKSNSWTELDMVVTHRCSDVAKFVTIYNYRNDPMRHDWYRNESVIELCEVQVFGCPVGKYGHGNCNQTCSENCYGGNCEASTGSCFYCISGKRGGLCDEDCPTNCNGSCEKDTGFCADCVSGMWGDTCDRDCSINCNNCIQNNGSCIDCVSGLWGDTCDRDCSINCKDCIQNNGSCIDCNVGKHGNSCELYCPTYCANNVCDKEFGLCVDCELGKRGEKCELDCSTKCKDLLCEKDTGFCSECIDGMYGYKCEKTCPAGCSSNKCRRSDGTCADTEISASTHTDNTTVVSVIAAVAGLFLLTSIASFVYILRIRTALKKEPEEATAADDHYAGIDIAGRDDPHTNYEMGYRNVITN